MCNKLSRRDELRHLVGFSAADEIEKLDRLKKAGSISDAEFIALVTPLANASSCWLIDSFSSPPTGGGQIEPAADEVHINDVCYWHLADIGEP